MYPGNQVTAAYKPAFSHHPDANSVQYLGLDIAADVRQNNRFILETGEATE
jgi:hypothetical protein